MKQRMLAMVSGCLLAGVVASHARVIDSFDTSGAGSGGGCAGSGSSVSNPIPNSFPPANNALGVIGSVSSTTAERRYEHLASGPDGTTYSFDYNISLPGQLFLEASTGCLFEALGTYDGIGTPGTGLSGQDLTQYAGNPECTTPTGTADRFLLDIESVDPDLEVEIEVTDTSSNTATLTRTGLHAGQEPFRYADFANGAGTDFSNVDKLTIKFSGQDVFLTLNSIVVSCAGNDLDGDGIADSEDVCPGSDLSSTVIVESCDSAVTNTRFPSGCTMADLMAECSTLRRQKACLRNRTRRMMALDVLNDQQRDAILTCAP